MVISKTIPMSINRAQSLLKRVWTDRHLNDWHSDVLETFVRILRPKVYVELGVYRCETFNRLQKFSFSSYGVDIDVSAGRFMKGSGSTFIHGDSLVAFEFLQNAGLEIDFLFIDGDHRSKAVKRDLANLVPLMSPNGLIALHDTWPRSEEFAADGYCSDSFRVPNEINLGTLGDWTSVTVPVHPGLTICARRHQLPAWVS